MPTNAEQVIHRTVGDTLDAIPITIYQDGSPKDLTGHTVTLKMVNKADDSVKLSAGACTVTSESGGQAEYPPEAADVDTAGTYYLWFTATETASGKTTTAPHDGRKLRLELHAKG